MITATDYLLMPDYPISTGQLAEVRAYRQALRDVPLQAGFPQTIDWPMPLAITTE
ncbi:phage tail assembly chaperone [Microvirgula aerodenitrificans]|uniref:phage tail assembly chaperone n=1 Tax=Microvirgula aerodenitrificans TaxID=57480 RepID=UPI00357097CF